MKNTFKITNQDMTIEDIVYMYGTYIYRFALKLTADSTLAEDLTQNTFINAWKNYHQLKVPQAIKKWLRVICYNEFKQYLRKDKKILIDSYQNIEDLEKDAHYLQDVEPLPIDEVIVKEEIKKLRDGCFLAMARKLTLHQRIVFSLVDMFGLSKDEVAQLLGISCQAVKGLLYRARMNLDSFFQGHCQFLDIHNACRCEAWLELMEDRSRFQKQMRETIDIFPKQAQNNHFDKETRQKVSYYYQYIPDAKPDDDWFDNLIKIIRKL